MIGQPPPINLWNILQGTTPGPSQNIFDPAADLASAVAAAHGDATTIRSLIEGALVAAMIAGALTSLIPTEANFGGPLAARLAGDMARPGIQVAINGPMEEYLLRVFPQKHLRAGMVVQGITEGVFSDAEIIEWCIASGLMENDVKMLLAYASAKRFDVLTKDDYATAQKAAADLIAYEIEASRIEYDGTIANIKVDLAQARKELKAGSTTYSGDLYLHV
jgi:hypothetical protein